MGIEVLHGHRGSRDVRFCVRWLTAASELRELFYEQGQGFDPFRYNETATVGFLVGAAGRAGLLALPEFTESNRKLPEGRVRAGRCDFWIASEDWEINWLIEFKIVKYGPKSRDGLVRILNKAVKNAHDRDRAEAGRRFGCVVYCPNDRWFRLGDKRRASWTTPRMIEALATHATYGFRFDGHAGPAYLLMQEIPPGARKVERYQIEEDVLHPLVS